MSPHKASNLRQLFHHDNYTAAFDSFLDLPAVLEGLRISTLHKMFAIRCDEVRSLFLYTAANRVQEILHYLRYIKDFWSGLLLQDQTAIAKVDLKTLKDLQLKVPWASTTDAKALRYKVLGGELFGLFNQHERDQIMTRLQNFRGIIPSLFEFFENLKCLETWAGCLKWLVKVEPRETMFMAINRIYSDRHQSINSALV